MRKKGAAIVPTDNRTNEPTPEQVEAAAIAFTCETQDEWERSPEPYKEMIREDIRAALVAAQGAAPQAAGERGDPYTCVDLGHEDCDGSHRDHCAPVLPSSGVDEEKLAEVIATATYDWSQQRLEFWRKPKNVEPPGDLDTFTARAVAAWLKGQGR